MRTRFVLGPLLVPWLVGCGAATGIPDGLSGSSTLDAGRPAHDASSPPFGDASRPDASTRDGSSSTTDAGRPDATTTGSDAGATFDAHRSDAGPDGSSPLGVEARFPGSGFAIFGVTDGGLLIYGDRAGTCWATPFTGGASTAISPATLTSDAGVGPCAAQSLFVVVSHDVVLMSNGYVAYSWTAALGAPALLPFGFSGPVLEGANPLTGTASEDSRYILWAFMSNFGPASYAVAAVDGSDALPAANVFSERRSGGSTPHAAKDPSNTQPGLSGRRPGIRPLDQLYARHLSADRRAGALSRRLRGIRQLPWHRRLSRRRRSARQRVDARRVPGGPGLRRLSGQDAARVHAQPRHERRRALRRPRADDSVSPPRGPLTKDRTGSAERSGGSSWTLDLSISLFHPVFG